MKEFAFILVVVLILLAITAIRYRKQINGMIGMVRMIRSAINPSKADRSISVPAEKTPSELVRCSTCETWVPRNRAIRFDGKTYYCSKQCVRVAVGS
jgi:hypothetical protein